MQELQSWAAQCSAEARRAFFPRVVSPTRNRQCGGSWVGWVSPFVGWTPQKGAGFSWWFAFKSKKTGGLASSKYTLIWHCCADGTPTEGLVLFSRHFVPGAARARCEMLFSRWLLWICLGGTQMEPTLQILSDFSHFQASLNRELQTGGPFCNRLFYGCIWPMVQGFDAPKGKKNQGRFWVMPGPLDPQPCGLLRAPTPPTPPLEAGCELLAGGVSLQSLASLLLARPQAQLEERKRAVWPLGNEPPLGLGLGLALV